MNGYTQRLGFDVLAAPLAEVDRRGLSQAWYSALHLAHAAAAPTNAPRAAGTVPKAPPAARTEMANARAERERTPEAPPRAAPRDASGARPAIAAPEERRRRSALGREIERVLARRKTAAPQRGSSLTVESPEGRVHLLLRSYGDRTHVVALCPSRMREQVSRALAQARYALAAQGIVLNAGVREGVR